MKKITWDNRNKMHIETGHKTFDRQTNLLCTGNVLANTLRGWHIRARNDTKCNGREWPVGHLQNFDIDAFGIFPMPKHIVNYIKNIAIDAHVWVYCLFHYNDRRRIVHGWVITWDDYRPIRKFVTGPTRKSYDVVYEAAKYLEEEE